MYIDYDSADVWANSHLFILDSNTLKPTVVSGIYNLIKKSIYIFILFRFSR